jgi:hemerythrin-like domain-containing protein
MTQTTASKNESKKPAKDAIALLEAEHAEARKALEKLADSSERAVVSRKDTLAEVGPALWIHMQIEEDIFYPAFERAMKKHDDEVMSIEARAEHVAAKTALARLEGCALDSTEFRAMAKVVNELVDHHASEEEEEMFPRARKLMSKDELLALGVKMEAAKQKLLRSGKYRKDERAAEHAQPAATIS